MKRLSGDSIPTPFAVLSLCMLGILIYSNTFNSPFCFDDTQFIVENPSIRDLRDLPAIWSYFPSRSISFLSFAFNYHFNQLRPFGYHLVNLAIHLAATVSVWWFILLTFSTPGMRDKEISRDARLLAFAGGLLFVAHPVQTEAVTYIWQRTACLGTLFYVLSLALYVKARIAGERGAGGSLGRVYYGLSLAAAGLGMFTKEMVFTLPLMILLYEFCFLSEGKKLKWKYVTPFLVLLLVIPLLVVFTEPAPSLEQKKLLTASLGIPRGHYFLTQFRVLATYLRLLFLPFNQNLDYDYPLSRSLGEIPTLASFLLLLLILLGGILLWGRHRLLSFSVFWFFLTLSVESSVIPLRNVIFEHRLYLPLVGYCVFLPAGLYYLGGRRRRALALAILAISAGSYSLLTYTRNIVWKSRLSLWDDTIRKSPGKARAYNNRGLAYHDLGEYDGAISDYDQALELNPRFQDAYANRGIAYRKKGEFDKAISDFDQALAIDPNCAGFYNGRGVTYKEKGEFDMAISDYDQALRIDPNRGGFYHNRARAYCLKKEYEKSWDDVKKAQSLGYQVYPEFLEDLRQASGRKE